VFYRTAHAEGLRLHDSLGAMVYENEPRSRATLRYQLRTFLAGKQLLSHERAHGRPSSSDARSRRQGGVERSRAPPRTPCSPQAAPAPLWYGLMPSGVGVMIGLLGCDTSDAS
jgi:hypothetical protein